MDRILGKIIQVGKHTVTIISHDNRVMEIQQTDILVAVPAYDRFSLGAMDA